MFKFQTLLCATTLAVGTIAASAQNATNTVNSYVPLAGLVRAASINRAFGQAPTTVNPLTYISLHGGAMVAPRGAGLVGADASIPGLSLGNGWHGRIDADVIFKANFGGIDTIVPITFDQLYYSPGGVGGHNVYYGAGIGAVLGGNTVFDGKLILGTEVTSKIGGEVNVHITERDTLVCLLARIHM
jgi:hypothetical protein